MTCHKPGRELDARIAHDVMEWRDVFDGSGYSPWSSYMHRYDIPPYSTSIEAAWGVVEKLKERHDFELHHMIYHGMGDAQGWYVKLDGQRVGFPQETAPHAICLAALRAVGQPL